MNSDWGGRLPIMVLFASSIGWGLTWLPLKFLGEHGMQGLALVVIAFGAAALLLVPVTVGQWARWRGRVHLLLLIALFGGFANLSFQIAIYHGNVIRVMILFYLLPVWSVLGGRLFLQEKIDRQRVVAVIAALAGAVLILGGPEVFTVPPNWIDLLAIGSGLSFALNNLVFRATEDLPTAGKVNAMFAGCALLALGYLFFQHDSVFPRSQQVLGWTLAYGLLWVMAITFGTQWGVERLAAGRAAIIIMMELVAAVFSAVLILGEQLEGLEWAGAALVIGAALLETFRSEPAPLEKLG